MRQELDIIEIFVKKDLGIKLTESEENLFHEMDEEMKQDVFDLVNSYSYIEEIVNVMDKIKMKSASLPVEEQRKIYEKCEEKKQKLQESNISHQK